MFFGNNQLPTWKILQIASNCKFHILNIFGTAGFMPMCFPCPFWCFVLQPCSWVITPWSSNPARVKWSPRPGGYKVIFGFVPSNLHNSLNQHVVWIGSSSLHRKFTHFKHVKNETSQHLQFTMKPAWSCWLRASVIPWRSGFRGAGLLQFYGATGIKKLGCCILRVEAGGSTSYPPGISECCPSIPKMKSTPLCFIAPIHRVHYLRAFEHHPISSLLETTGFDPFLEHHPEQNHMIFRFSSAQKQCNFFTAILLGSFVNVKDSTVTFKFEEMLPVGEVPWLILVVERRQQFQCQNMPELCRSVRQHGYNMNTNILYTISILIYWKKVLSE